MLHDIRRAPANKRPHCLIVDHTDRLSRNLRVLLNIIHELTALGVSLYTSKGPVDLHPDQGIIGLQIEGIFAEQYLRNLAQETKKGLREKARQGHWVGGCPYGYERISKNTIAPATYGSADAVRLAFGLYQTEVYSVAQLADVLNQQASRWGRTFGTESLRDILHNRAYCGYVSSGREEFKGNHEPLITEEQWQICATIRATRTRHRTARHSGQTSTVLLVGGIGRCHCCSQPLWASNSGRQSVGHHYSYYRCAGSSRRNCTMPQQPATIIDQQVFELIEGFSLAVEYHQEAIDELLEIAPAPLPNPAPVDPIKVQTKIDRLSVAWVNGNISDDLYEQQLAALKAQLVVLPAPEPQPPIDLTEARRLLGNLPAVWQAATLPERRMLTRMLFEAIEVSERRIKAIQPTKTYGVLLFAARHMNRQIFSRWSGRRDSNSQPSAWKADALPLRYSRVCFASANDARSC